MRELVGYYRYDTAAELAKLNEIWELDAVFANYLLPQQKLVFKQRSEQCLKPVDEVGKGVPSRVSSEGQVKRGSR